MATPASDIPASHSTQSIVQQAVQANKDHQYALKVYTERLEGELQTVNRLLTLADVEDQEDEVEMDVGGYILAPGSKKATGLVSANDLLTRESPFYADAQKRMRYLNFTCIHPMKSRDLDALAEAVRTENCRKQAFEAQQRGQFSFADSEPSQIDIELNTEGLDWDRIAERVSAATHTTRSPKECEIRWLGDRHPNINHAPWSQTELSQLKTVTELSGGQFDWVKIAKDLGTNRSPIDCMRHGVYRRNHVWTPESDDLLMQSVGVYGLDNWNLVARHVSEDVTGIVCQSRYSRTLDPTLKRGNWTPEEDNMLRLAFAEYGNSWTDVADYIPGRNNDQCRDRWTDSLDSGLAKRKWTDEEDLKLLQEVETLGVKWKEISIRMGKGRSDSMCRARYEVLVKRKSDASAATTSEGSTSRSRLRTRKVSATAVVDATPSTSEDRRDPSLRPKPRQLTRSKDDSNCKTATGGHQQEIIPPIHAIDIDVQTSTGNGSQKKNIPLIASQGIQVNGKNQVQATNQERTVNAGAVRTSESVSEDRSDQERSRGQSVLPINEHQSLGLPESFPQTATQTSRDDTTDGNELPVQQGARISPRKRPRNSRTIVEESPIATSDKSPKKRNRTRVDSRMEPTRQSARINTRNLSTQVRAAGGSLADDGV